jgi:Ca-activated chloride channel family protein
MELKGKLAKNSYVYDRNNETHLLVELKAPKVNWKEERAPICVVPVLDVSGSMGGQKIDYVRKACRKLMDHLAPGDFAGLVAFETYVHPIAEPREITQEQKEILKKKIGNLNVGSTTNMSGGLFQALEWINNLDISEKFVLRVILFTDGHANRGITGRNLLEAAIKQKGKASISTFGFGTDCDQELLADIANKCGGNYAFIDSPDQAMSAFARELGGLMSTYGQNINVRIEPDKNNKVLEVLNDEDVEDDGNITTIKLQDILGEESKYIVAKVRLNEVDKPLPRKVNAFKVSVSYTDKEGSKKDLKDMPIKVKFCKPGDEPAEEDAEVVKHRDRLMAAQAQDQAEAFARLGDYEAARGVMIQCCSNISDSGIKKIAEDMSSNYTDAGTYSSSAGTTKAVRQSLKRGRVMSYSLKDADCIESLSLNNAAMDDMVNSFTSEGSTTNNDGTYSGAVVDGNTTGNINSSDIEWNDVVDQPAETSKKKVKVEPKRVDKKGKNKKRSNRDW